ncbi:hypothetical protein BO71DRAFT_376595 [Aspergillus ellipticus CBS 707.79]|uniref:Pentatricopeptide repeat protein n=1 Tax=Aspergillus ellipticus CBS 707.79 TaxID=1448320 RepID=A0A319DP16_9EURO|nr:hypothetical protein BO71DRAFT_376595 [Aspergillus ellipticus CBS 707.79]
MLSRPQHRLRLCFRAGGRLRGPQHRLRLDHRGQRTAAPGARSFGDSTLQSGDTPDGRLDAPHSPPGPQPEDGLIDPSRPIKLPAARILYRTKLQGWNGAAWPRERYLTDKTKILEHKIRNESLFSGGADSRRWENIRNQMYKRRDAETVDFTGYEFDDMDVNLYAKIRSDCQGSFRQSWEKLDQTEKQVHWERLSLALLRDNHKLLLEFLWVTCQGVDRPAFKMLVDCLTSVEYRSPALRYDWSKGALTFSSVIECCLAPEHWPIIYTPQKGVRLYAKWAQPRRIRRAWRVALNNGVHLKAETYLCFLSRFTELRDIDMALEAVSQLVRLRQEGLTMDSERVGLHLRRLLALDSVADTQGGRNFRILPRLLATGVRPNISIMNAVLENSFRTGDRQLALDTLGYIHQLGMAPNSFTYVARLRDAINRRDREQVTELVREIDADPDPSIKKNPYVASKVFHAHFVFTVKDKPIDFNPESTFYSMLNMYNELYDITPLKELSIVSPGYTPPGDNTEKLVPSRVAMLILIATYLRCQRKVTVAERVYLQFRSLLHRGDALMTELVQSEHVYNEFLCALRWDPRGGRPAVRLVQDMLTMAEKDPDNHTKPSVLTWTLLLSAFIYTKQPRAAEKVKQMMARHGISYDLSTWNLIISGFAGSQDVAGIANAIRTLERDGMAPDEYTMKALHILRDPERLWAAVNNLEAKNDAEQHKEYFNSQSADEQTEQLIDHGLKEVSELRW